MKTQLEKTLFMRLSYVMGELLDKANEYEVEAEQASKYDNCKYIKRYYANDIRKFVDRLKKEIEEINYLEIE